MPAAPGFETLASLAPQPPTGQAQVRCPPHRVSRRSLRSLLNYRPVTRPSLLNHRPVTHRCDARRTGLRDARFARSSTTDRLRDPRSSTTDRSGSGPMPAAPGFETLASLAPQPPTGCETLAPQPPTRLRDARSSTSE